MNKKCIGCGITLQDNNTLIKGYTKNISNKYCERCFRLIHYGEYKNESISKKEMEQILKNIEKTNALVLFVVDVLSVPNDFSMINNLLKNNDIILVINKNDVLPYSIKPEKLKQYFKTKYDFFKDIIVVSGKKNYNLDLLMEKIDKYKKSNEIYIIGNTNAGKSTLINKIIKNYSLEEQESITISPLPSTTLDEIKIKIKDYYLIDTPGFVDDNNILNYVDNKMINKISPKKEIKPITYVLKENNSILIEDLIRIDYKEKETSSFTFYISNDLEIKRIKSNKHDYLKNYNKKELNLKGNKDLVINGLGFIKTTTPCKVDVYIKEDFEIYIRDCLI